MRRIFCFALMALSIVACRKTKSGQPVTQHPEMKLIKLGDSAIAFGRYASYDLDGNGTKDISFSTLLVGDGVNQQDKKQWYVNTTFDTNLPVNTQENIPMLNANDSVPLNDFDGYTWYNAGSVILAQKIIGLNHPPFWEGIWKTANHHFIPVQVLVNNNRYNGWVEVSFNTTLEQVILHKAAISLEPNRGVLAGK